MVMGKGYKYILASGSPRRRELLSGLGLQFCTRLLPGIDETYPATLRGEEIPIAISRKKSDAYRATMADGELIITADTIVLLDDKVIGKPRDDQDACRMLRLLSGRTHKVITGVTLLTKERQHSFACTSGVTFCELTDWEIEQYVSTSHPLDKAGAYGIQEWIGYIGVTRIDGSFYNVMGLPVQRLYRELRLFN